MRRRYAVVLVHARVYQETVMLNATGQRKREKLRFIRRANDANAGFAPGHKYQVRCITPKANQLNVCECHGLRIRESAPVKNVTGALATAWRSTTRKGQPVAVRVIWNKLRLVVRAAYVAIC